MASTHYSPTQLEIEALRDFLTANGFRAWTERNPPGLETLADDPRLTWEGFGCPSGQFSFNRSGGIVRIFPSQDHTLRDFIFEIADSMRTADANAEIAMPATEVWEQMRTSYFTMEEAYHVAAIADDMGAEYVQTTGHEGRVHVAVVPDVGHPSIDWKTTNSNGIYLDSEGFRATKGPNETYVIRPGRGQSSEDFVASLAEIMTVERTTRAVQTPAP